MSSLYPEFYFTLTSHDGLFGILKHTFTVSYARETINGTKKSTGFAVPMVSFCDLKLSELKAHMNKYGKYGIGLSKKWANSKGLNPVFYVNKHCPFTSNFLSAVERLHTLLESIDDGEILQTASEAYMDIFNTYRYIKNYQGDLKRKGRKTIENYRFADEREWRYVPPLNKTDYPFVPLEKIETDEQKKALNNNISRFT